MTHACGTRQRTIRQSAHDGCFYCAKPKVDMRTQDVSGAEASFVCTLEDGVNRRLIVAQFKLR